MDSHALIFAAIGAVGFVLLLVSLFLGDLFELGDSVDSDAGPSWFNTQVISASLVGFGVFGYIADNFGLPEIFLWPIACLGFFSIGAVTFYGVVRPLRRQESNSHVMRDSYKNQIARVILAIPPKGTGQVAFYNSNGVYVTQVAESHEDTELPAGSSVLIYEVDKHRVHVMPSPELLQPKEQNN